MSRYICEEMTLITVPVGMDSSFNEESFEADLVVGLATERTPLAYANGHIVTGEEEALVVEMHHQVTARVADFYRRCLVVPPARAPVYDPLKFAGYALGAAGAELHRPHGWVLRGAGRLLTGRQVAMNWSAEDIVPADGLEPGKAYFIHDITRLDDNHVVLGIDDPATSLSISSEQGQLMIANNTDIARACGSAVIRRLLPA